MFHARVLVLSTIACEHLNFTIISFDWDLESDWENVSGNHWKNDVDDCHSNVPLVKLDVSQIANDLILYSLDFEANISSLPKNMIIKRSRFIRKPTW